MATATAKASFKLDGIGKDNAPAVGGSVKLRKKINDISFSVSLTDATVKGYGELKDVVFEASKDVGSGLKANLEYNAGKKATKVTGTWINPAKDVTLKGTWVEKGNAFKGEATVVLDDENEVGATYDWSSSKATATWTHIRGSSTLASKYHFADGGVVLTATTKRNKDTYKVDADLMTNLVTLEYSRKPYKLVGKGTLTNGGVSDMSVSLTAEAVIDL